jgi:hypothetical protein
MAYTASISEPVIVTAPPRSSGTRSRGAASAGSHFSAKAATASPIGRLTRKIECQPKPSVSSPPASTPMLPPLAQTKP